MMLTRSMTDGAAEKQKRAVVSPFGAGLRGENGAKHLNPDNSPAKQLAPAPLADAGQIGHMLSFLSLSAP